MKLGYVSIIFVIVITSLNIFYKNIYLSVSAILILLFAIIIFITNTGKWKSLTKSIESSWQEKLEKEKIKSENALSTSNSRITKTETLLDESNGHIKQLHRILTELDIITPIIGKLSEVIINKSEESTINATEKVFTIVEESQNVSKDIQALLENMSKGDHSLDQEMDRFKLEVENFQEIVDKAEYLKKSYISDMERIKKTVLNISSLAKSIADIADQTSILAINASIEAARAGSSGSGFAVIAGETQKLASTSKEITEKITYGIKEIGSTIANSFQNQSETLSITVNHLHEAKGSFNQMTADLAPQIKSIEPSVKRSRALSDSVTSKLNEITMSLQYQDATRQILEHIIKIVEELQNKFISLDISNTPQFTENRDLINTEILERISKIFTVREEWTELGLELEEIPTGEVKKEENLQGDITLF